MGPSATPCCVGFLRVPSSITSVGDLLWLFCTDCLDLRELRFGGGGAMRELGVRIVLVCAFIIGIVGARIAVRTDVYSE